MKIGITSLQSARLETAFMLHIVVVRAADRNTIYEMRGRARQTERKEPAAVSPATHLSHSSIVTVAKGGDHIAEGRIAAKKINVP